MTRVSQLTTSKSCLTQAFVFFFEIPYNKKKKKMAPPPEQPPRGRRQQHKYVSSSGTTRQSRPLFRATMFADFFWGLLNILAAFFRTLVSLEHSQKYGTKAGDIGSGVYSRGPSSGGGGGGGGGGNGTRRYGGSNIHGIDHNFKPPST
jgi:uncharacterized membrane protein YgcG